MTPSGRWTKTHQLLVALVVIARSLSASGIVWLRRAMENRIVIVNRSGQALSRMIVTVHGSGSCPTFRSLPDRVEASASFDIRGYGGLTVEGSLAAGTRIKGGISGT